MKKYIVAFICFCAIYIVVLGFITYKANSSYNLSSETIDLSWNGRIETDSGTYIGSLIGDYFSGNGDFYFLSGEMYSGSWQNSYMEGDGSIVFPGYGRYSGNMSDSQRNGQGTFTFDNGDVYKGNWENDVMSGTGTYTFSDGGEFIGTFTDNKPVDGVYTRTTKLSSNEDGPAISYISYAISGNTQKLTFKTKDGLSFSGDLLSLFGGGNARITYSSGNTYEGSLKNGKRNGQGTFYWVDSKGKKLAYYEGNWVNDFMNGSGKYHYNSSEYPYLSGQFVSNYPDGTLTYYKEANNTFETKWSKGVCSGITET